MKIHCAYDKLVPLIELESRRHPKNPNTHSAAQVAAIAAVLEGNGWRQPVVVSNRSGLITKGHGRLDVALMLGFARVSVAP
jgi:ParB-like chromosome segregation protein Spo0J